MVDLGLSHGPEEVVGMYESDGMAGSDGSISASLSDEALAHADRSDEQDVLVACQELKEYCRRLQGTAFSSTCPVLLSAALQVLGLGRRESPRLCRNAR